MDRLLVARLESCGCAAEVLLNGVPIARVSPAQPLALLPVHEFVMAGDNQLSLVVQPSPSGTFDVSDAQLSDGKAWASVHLLLPRIGQTAHPFNARTLAHLDWRLPADQFYETPLLITKSVQLPIAFPRWRWLSVPVLAEHVSVRDPAVKLLRRLAADLVRGDPESFLDAARLRIEEVALAYQRKPADEVGRWRAQIRALRDGPALKPHMPSMQSLVLRRVASGRLLECLGADGLPALRASREDGSGHVWPIRIACVDTQLHILR
jgi:hypothetical protein